MEISLKVNRKANKSTVSYPNIITAGYNPSLFYRMMNIISPYWYNLKQMEELTKMLDINPVLFAVLGVRAKYLSLIKVGIKDINTGRIIDPNKLEKYGKLHPIAEKMIRLIQAPNSSDSLTEFIRFQSFTKDLYGNSQINGNFSSYSKKDISTIETMTGLLPYRMKPSPTGRFRSATKLSEIIDHWEYNNINGKIEKIDTSDILHRKETNLSSINKEDFILGRSRAISLSRPLSTICVNYESLNVIGRERGMKTIISPDQTNPVVGSLPFEDEQEKQLKEKFKNGYGTLEGQSQFHFSPFPIKVDQLDQDIRKLNLLEQNAADTMIVCHSYDVPEVLLKMYPQGTTYENYGKAEIKMIKNTSIPEMEDLLSDISLWLKTFNYGYCYVPLYDHIDVLQEYEKERSLIRTYDAKVCRDALRAGTITINEYRTRIGYERTNAWYGDMTLIELYEKDPVFAQLILNNAINVESNNPEGQNPNANK